MSQICLEKIVSVRDVCSTLPTQNTSGYDLMDAPEINIGRINDIANAEYNSGYKILKNCVRLALRDMQNDFISTLSANNIIASSTPAQDIATGNFSSLNTNNANGLKGIVLHKRSSEGIKKLRVKKLRIYPVNDHESVDIKFIDSGNQSVIKVALVGGQVNEFAIDYTAEGDEIKILMEGVQTYSSVLTCLIGCGGSMPNQCGYVKGWNGYSEVNSEGFGINAVFSCECDYSQILCQQSRNFVGLLIWIKARINVLEERINSTRINPFVIYGAEDAKQQRLELLNEYNEKWNLFIQTIPNIIQSDECFTCNKSKIVTNI